MEESCTDWKKKTIFSPFKTPEGCEAVNHNISGAFIWEKRKNLKKMALFCEEFGTEQGYL